jgi:phosphoribosylaminoimidazole-succinocarboxamide synthase
MADVVSTVGPDLAAEMERVSIAVYERAAADCAEAGIILADTKFEMGTAQGTLTLGDEVCTPDSSRFWPADTYAPGTSPPSFDKQYLRDWLDQSGWDHSPPAPELPADVVAGTRERYVEAYERITGRSPSCRRKGCSTPRARRCRGHSRTWASPRYPTCAWASASSWR